MPKDTKTLGNNKARAWESLGFVHKKRLGQRFDTTSLFILISNFTLSTTIAYSCLFLIITLLLVSNSPANPVFGLLTEKF